MNDIIIYKSNDQKMFSKLSWIYTFILIMSPLLFLYGIGIKSITLIDFLLMTLNFIFVIKIMIDGKISIAKNLFPFLMYVIILSLIVDIDIDAFMRTLRYILYLINIIFFGKKYYDYDLGVKIYRFISLVSTGYLFVQILIYRFFGIYLSGVILSANLVAVDLYDYHLVLQQAQMKRFMSFFAEPSHLAIYLLGYITILLFSKMKSGNYTKKNVFEFVFLSIGVALSSSILGILVLSFMTAIWLVIFIFNRVKNIEIFIKLVLFVSVVLIVLVLISQTSAFEYFTNRNVLNRQAEGRFSGYSIFKDWDSNVSVILFGRGMVGMVGNGYSDFLPSYPLLVYYFGYIGLFLFIVAFIPYLISLKMNISKALTICLLGITLGSEILLGIFILLFLPLIINAKNNG